MPLGVLNLPIPCLPLVIPVRIALCVPLIFITLDGYIKPNNPDEPTPPPPVGQADPNITFLSPYLGHNLVLVFALLSVATSLVSLLLACVTEPESHSDRTESERDRNAPTRMRRERLLGLALGIVTRLALAVLGSYGLTMVMLSCVLGIGMAYRLIAIFGDSDLHDWLKVQRKGPSVDWCDPELGMGVDVEGKTAGELESQEFAVQSKDT